MFYRPLLLVTIVMSALFCGAQIRNFDKPSIGFDFPATVTGSILDNTGRPINGAHIVVINPETQRQVADVYSLPNGSFQIDNLRHGEYDIVATAGLSESRSHVEVDGARDLSLQLQTNQPATNDQATVSLSQMKVPNKARSLFQKAQQAFRKSRIDEAFAFVQKALTCYPNYAKALVLRGILNMQKGDNKDAQPDLERAVQLDYGDDTGYVALASLYNNEKEFDRAQQTLEHGIPLHPNSWQANLELARAQLGKKDYGAAVRSLDRAAEFAPPTMTLMHLYRAQAFIGLQDYNGAITELQTYLSKSPNDANANAARDTLAKLKEFTASAQK